MKIKLDITGDKGCQTDDIIIPPGYYINGKVIPESKLAPTAQGQQPFTFPFGAGGLIMNGCFGSGYKPGDHCYDATWATIKRMVSLVGLNWFQLRGTNHNLTYKYKLIGILKQKQSFRKLKKILIYTSCSIRKRTRQINLF